MSLLYQWQRDSGTGWEDMAGETNASLDVTVSDSTENYDYRCVVTSSWDETKSTESTAATLTQLANDPTISSQPVNQKGALNENAVFSVTASAPYGSLSYQWQYNEGSGWEDSGSSGATTDTITIAITGASDGRQYRCIVTANAGGATVTSDSATIEMEVAPVITQQPSNQSGEPETNATFTVAATSNAGPITYQWQYNSGSGWENSTATGATTDTLTVFINHTSDGRQYRCIVTNDIGSTTSSSATLTMNVPNPTITQQPTDQSGYPTETVTFTITAEE